MKEYHKIQTVFKRDPETRFKALPEGEYSIPEFEYLKDNEWVFTEKVDGTNIRVIYDQGKIKFKGKTERSQIPSTLYERLSDRFNIRKNIFADEFEDGVCLYGEGYVARPKTELKTMGGDRIITKIKCRDFR